MLEMEKRRKRTSRGPVGISWIPDSRFMSTRTSSSFEARPRRPVLRSTALHLISLPPSTKQREHTLTRAECNNPTVSPLSTAINTSPTLTASPPIPTRIFLHPPPKLIANPTFPSLREHSPARALHPRRCCGSRRRANRQRPLLLPLLVGRHLPSSRPTPTTRTLWISSATKPMQLIGTSPPLPQRDGSKGREG
jgi:hypothetical protein